MVLSASPDVTEFGLEGPWNSEGVILGFVDFLDRTEDAAF